MKRKRTILLFVGLIALLIIDIVTKAYTYQCIPPIAWSSPIYPYGGIAVFQDFYGIDFSINYVMNKGAAWGVLASLQDYLLYIRLFLIGGMISYLIFSKSQPVFKIMSIALVTTGAIGNVIDYFVYGHVVDMFYFRFWGYSYPVFNVADSCIFLGIAFLFFQMFLEKSSKEKKLKTQNVQSS